MGSGGAGEARRSFAARAESPAAEVVGDAVPFLFCFWALPRTALARSVRIVRFSFGSVWFSFGLVQFSLVRFSSGFSACCVHYAYVHFYVVRYKMLLILFNMKKWSC